MLNMQAAKQLQPSVSQNNTINGINVIPLDLVEANSTDKKAPLTIQQQEIDSKSIDMIKPTSYQPQETVSAFLND